jgi:hypothetical protein
MRRIFEIRSINSVPGQHPGLLTVHRRHHGREFGLGGVLVLTGVNQPGQDVLDDNSAEFIILTSAQVAQVQDDECFEYLEHLDEIGVLGKELLVIRDTLLQTLTGILPAA